MRYGRWHLRCRRYHTTLAIAAVQQQQNHWQCHCVARMQHREPLDADVVLTNENVAVGPAAAAACFRGRVQALETAAAAAANPAMYVQQLQRQWSCDCGTAAEVH